MGRSATSLMQHFLRICPAIRLNHEESVATLQHSKYYQSLIAIDRVWQALHGSEATGEGAPKDGMFATRPYTSTRPRTVAHKFSRTAMPHADAQMGGVKGQLEKIVNQLKSEEILVAQMKTEIAD